MRALDSDSKVSPALRLHSIPETGQAYVVAILENYSRAILASAVTLSQDTNAYLLVLHAAIGRYGSPKAIVTDGGGIFRSDRAKTARPPAAVLPSHAAAIRYAILGRV